MSERDGGTEPDREALRELADRIDRLAETAAELRDLGEEHGIPAVERNAKRIEGVIDALERNVPEELVEE
jgi:hypothetical protein